MYVFQLLKLFKRIIIAAIIFLSGIRDPVSGIRYQVSSIKNQVSRIKYPVSSIQYPVSSILLYIPRYCLKNSSAFSFVGCCFGRTIRKPTKLASVNHHLLLGICGSRRFHDGSDLNRLAQRTWVASSKKLPPRNALG